jgi:hypothetical protein
MKTILTKMLHSTAACLASIALVFFNISSCYAASVDKPFLYSGFAFSGDSANRKVLYPFTSELARDENGAYIDRLLREKVRQDPELMKLLRLDLSDGKSDETSLAFALVQESTEVQKVEGKYWAILNLQANVLAFNRSSRSVVASYPLRLRLTEEKETPPSRADFKAMVRDAFSSPDPQVNILDLWLKRVRSSAVHRGARKYLRITEIVLEQDAEQIVLAAGRKPAAIRNQVANLLESSFSENAGISLVPNSVGEAIGSKMMLSFSNGSAMQLTLPEADYAVKFTVRDFASKKIELAGSFQDIYRSKATIAIRMPDTGHTFIDEKIYDTQIVTRPKQAGIELDDWNQYYKSLQSLIFGLGTQLEKVDSSWLEEHAARGNDAKEAFVQAHKLAQELQ